ncbi:MAG: FecR domain-containing protein [Pseudomonas sp.]
MVEPARAPRRAAEAAAHWHLILHDGSAGATEREAFLAWLRASPRHVGEYLAVVELHGELRSAARRVDEDGQALCERALRDDGVVVPLRLASPPPTRSPRRARLPRRRRWAVAALLPLLALGAATWLGRPASLATQRYAAGAEPRELTLADGSRVSLDRGALIEVGFERDRRQIVLVRGNALFDVEHDPARPLRISAGAVDLHDIGTVFSVRRQAQATEVTVLSGQVQVRPAAARWFAQWRPAPGLLADLRGGQQARLDAQGRLSALQTHADLRHATAWLPDQATLHDLSWSELARRFNAYTDTPLAIEDPGLAARRASGVFHLRDSEALLAYLASQPGVRIVREPGRIRVLAAR